MSANQFIQTLEQISGCIAKFKPAPQGTQTLVELKETLAQDQEYLTRLIRERRDLTTREQQVLGDSRRVHGPRQDTLLESLTVLEGIMAEEQDDMANLRRLHEESVSRDFKREIMFEIDHLVGRRFSREQARTQIEVELEQINSAFIRHTQEYYAIYADIDRKIEEAERAVQRAKQLIDEDIAWYRDQYL
ncbi:uncharacterized protein PAC_01600 [Phialocephala subalpina]|uniref:Uncharacterized protein n=1 Tax=Phialocephala subalpina TaxID=576137 RepID=A0A1L7WG26_9HELO|nr:uncharacterized protein PAC_01600 [Phialocephala subalpina]